MRLTVGEVRGQRLVLRPLRQEDRERFSRLLAGSADAWASWSPQRPAGETPDERFEAELRQGAEGRAGGTHLRLGGFDADGELVGLFALNDIVRGALQSAHLSWYVDVAREGHGFGTEGAAMLLDLAFGDEPHGLGLHRVQADVMPANTASLRVADKLGLRREGLARGYLRIAGRWEDHLTFALTREEWRGAPTGSLPGSGARGDASPETTSASGSAAP